jgi:predicted metal-dependent hydrolase
MPKDPGRRNLQLLSDGELEERRPVLLAGIGQFNGGYFFEAHETLEDLWYLSPWPGRQFLQGLIQTAAAFVHLMRHQYPGTVRLLGHALAKLDEFPDEYMGIDAGRLRREVARARDELVELGEERFDEWDRARIPAVHFVTVP